MIARETRKRVWKEVGVRNRKMKRARQGSTLSLKVAR